MAFCRYTREVAGVIHSCELPDGHETDHMFAFTGGQLRAMEYALSNPSTPSFPSEALLLCLSAIGIETFAGQRTALDHAVSVYMLAIAIRWIRIWLREKRQ